MSSDERLDVRHERRHFSIVYHDVSAELTPYELAVYVALLKFADGVTGHAFPSVPKVAKTAGVSRETAFRVLNQLEGKGLISRQARFTDGNGNVSAKKSAEFNQQFTSLYTVRDRFAGSSDCGDPSCLTDTGGCLTDTRVVSDRHGGSVSQTHKLYPQELNPHELTKGLSDDNPLSGDVNKPQRNTYPADFEQFWRAYPRRKGDKKKALSKFKEIKADGVSGEVLIAAAERFATECKQAKTAQQYIAYPVTFLSQRRFENYLADSSVKSDRSSRAAQMNEWAKELLEAES